VLDGLEIHEGKADSFWTFHRAVQGHRTAMTEEPAVGDHGEEGEGRDDTVSGPPEAKRKPRGNDCHRGGGGDQHTAQGDRLTQEASNKAPTKTQGTRRQRRHTDDVRTMARRLGSRRAYASGGGAWTAGALAQAAQNRNSVGAL